MSQIKWFLWSFHTLASILAHAALLESSDVLGLSLDFQLLPKIFDGVEIWRLFEFLCVCLNKQLAYRNCILSLLSFVLLKLVWLSEIFVRINMRVNTEIRKGANPFSQHLYGFESSLCTLGIFCESFSLSAMEHTRPKPRACRHCASSRRKTPQFGCVAANTQTTARTAMARTSWTSSYLPHCMNQTNS